MSLPDVFGFIKAYRGGSPFDEGLELNAKNQKVLLKYFVVNDSETAVGPIKVGGNLRKDGALVTPKGQAVVPVETITLQPGKRWKGTYEFLPETGPGGAPSKYRAAVFADLGDHVKEEDETNNKDVFEFSFFLPPK